MTEMTSGPLAGLLVVDLVEGSAGVFASKLLGMLGAEIIKVERPDGDPLRTQAPFVDGIRGTERSLRWNHHAANSHSVVLDLEDGRDRRVLRDIALRADVLLENRPIGWLEARGLHYESMKESAPGLIFTSMTPFGQTGPQSSWLAGDLVAYAMGGMMALTGEPDRSPVRLAGAQAEHLVGLFGAIGSLAALASRESSGLGQYIDVSMQEAVASSFVDAGFTLPQVDGTAPSRNGTQHPLIVPLFSAPAEDGLIIINCPMPNQFATLMAWVEESGIELPAELRDPSLAELGARMPLREIINTTIGRATALFPKAHTYVTLQSRSAPAAPINAMADLAANAQLAARDYFDPIELAVDGRAAALPGPPFRFSKSTLSATRRAPQLDEERASALAATQRARRSAPTFVQRRSRDRRGGALEGLRVIDFSWALAGPWTARMLATDGAEVIRVESGRRLDTLRAMGSAPDRSATYIDANAGKRSVTLDLTSPGGADIGKRLAATADVVLENFRPGVMDRFGLGYETLAKDNPGLIMCSMPAFGSTGPECDFVAYGPVLLALSGITNSTGYPDGAPTAIGSGYVDQVSAAHAAVAILAAVQHRDRTGEGQHVEISQFEAAVGVLDSRVLEHFTGSPDREREGNRDPNAAPHGCYRCVGDDAWVVVSVLTDEQWLELARLLKRDDLAADAELRTLEGRLSRQDELDTAVTEWTSDRTPDEAMHTLQAAGVPAGAVQGTRTLLQDKQLRAREFFERVEHPVAGPLDLLRAPYRLSGTPGGLQGRAGPLLGVDTENVLHELLGVTPADYQALVDAGAVDAPLVGTQP